MSDHSESTEDEPGNAERLFRALGSAAVDASTRETLTQLGDRARGVVEELARAARARAESASASTAASSPAGESEPHRESSAEEFPAGAEATELYQRLHELRACLGEVTDVLEGTVERLETVERQLGEAEDGPERNLHQGMERCERVLLGIEHWVARTCAAKDSKTTDSSGWSDLPTVLLVARSSKQRARLCVALERQGLRVHAAIDMAGARRAVAMKSPNVALLAFESAEDSAASFVAEWKNGQDAGFLPYAAVIGPQGAALGVEEILEEHGDRAMAASLVRLVQFEK